MTAEKQEKPQFEPNAIIKALQNALCDTSSYIVKIERNHEHSVDYQRSKDLQGGDVRLS